MKAKSSLLYSNCELLTGIDELTYMCQVRMIVRAVPLLFCHKIKESFSRYFISFVIRERWDRSCSIVVFYEHVTWTWVKAKHSEKNSIFPYISFLYFILLSFTYLYKYKYILFYICHWYINTLLLNAFLYRCYCLLSE